jgi:hypothetical protein
MFAKLFNPDSAMIRLDQSEAERLRQVFAADRLLRRERAGWGGSVRPNVTWCPRSAPLAACR